MAGKRCLYVCRCDVGVCVCVYVCDLYSVASISSCVDSDPFPLLRLLLPPPIDEFRFHIEYLEIHVLPNRSIGPVLLRPSIRPYFCMRVCPSVYPSVSPLFVRVRPCICASIRVSVFMSVRLPERPFENIDAFWSPGSLPVCIQASSLPRPHILGIRHRQWGPWWPERNSRDCRARKMRTKRGRRRGMHNAESGDRIWCAEKSAVRWMRRKKEDVDEMEGKDNSVILCGSQGPVTRMDSEDLKDVRTGYNMERESETIAISSAGASYSVG